jgi:hypothetical protein
MWHRVNSASSFFRKHPFRDRAVHFVGGHLNEAKSIPVRRSKPLPVCERTFQQIGHALHVGRNEIGRIINRAVDVTFGGEVEYRTRAVLGEKRGHEPSVADITLYEDMKRIAGDLSKVIQIA